MDTVLSLTIGLVSKMVLMLSWLVRMFSRDYQRPLLYSQQFDPNCLREEEIEPFMLQWIANSPFPESVYFFQRPDGFWRVATSAESAELEAEIRGVLGEARIRDLN